MEDLYKSLQTSIFEVITKKKSEHKSGDVWQTASGWAAKNSLHYNDYAFMDEKSAKEWAAGSAPARTSSDATAKMDTSCPVKLDKDGNCPKELRAEKKAAKEKGIKTEMFYPEKSRISIAQLNESIFQKTFDKILSEEFDSELTETKIIFDMPNFDYDEMVEYLDDNGVDWEEEDGVITILDPVEGAEIDVDVQDDDDDDVEESFEIETELLGEGAAKRKIVVRKGKRRILFMCAPGMMKRSPRVCVRRPGSSLRKMKLRSKRSARKARSKKNISSRRRKISVRKRLSFGIRLKKKKR